jgi:hypothetical protein
MIQSLNRPAFILVCILVLSPVGAFILPTTSSTGIRSTLLQQQQQSRQQQQHFVSQSSSPILRNLKDTSFSKASPLLLASLSSSDDGGEGVEPELDNIQTVTSSFTTTSDGAAETTIAPSTKKPLWERVVSLYRRTPNDTTTTPVDDGLTFRQRLAKAGISVVLSYGWVSNMSYCVSVSAAWYIFCQRTRLSPLAAGQWPKFLAVYSGFWVFNNVVRPIRFAVSVAISTQFDNIVSTIQRKANVGKGVAVGITVFLANVVGTTALMCAGIAMAASLAGVPIFPSK